MVEIEDFGIKIAEKEARERLEEISGWPGVERIVALPDVHQKRHLEAPTSIAVATNGVIVPALTTPTLGCSMGIITTDLKREQIDEPFLQNFFLRIKDHLTFSPPSRLRTLLTWFALISPKIDKSSGYDFSRYEVEQAAKSGARAVLAKYKFPEETLEHMEAQGENLDDLSDLIPRSGWQFSRSNIGYGFHGNHFLELQYIDEIIDEKVAGEWGLKKDQVIASYHGGEGALAFFIGRYFSNHRKKFSFKEELMRLPAKLLFHKSLKYYFGEKLLAIPVNSSEGKRYMRAIQAGANYGAAGRLAMVRRIIDALGVAGKLLWDTSHTTITQEKISGKDFVLHRNGAVKIVPGKPVLISGSDKVRSYLGVGHLSSAGADKFLNSIDHGAGETIKRMGETGHDYIVKVLENANLVKPVAYLKPIKTFRD